MRNPKDVILSHPAGVLLVLFVCIGIISIRIDTRKESSDISSPLGGLYLLQEMISGVGDFFGNSINAIQELKNLQEEYDSLQEKMKEMEIHSVDIESLKRENRELKEQLSYSNTITYSHLSAKIIAMDPGSLFSGMTINKGSQDGVVQDLPVIGFQDGEQALIGKIISVNKGTSKVIPIFDKNCFVAVRFQRSRYEGLLSGNGEKYGFLTVRYVNKQAVNSIVYGDKVFTSGLQSIYPPEIAVGIVRGIESPEWQASLLISVEPIISQELNMSMY